MNNITEHVTWIEDEAELETVLENSPKVVIDFTAPSWCRPCQQFAPHFEKAAAGTDATFVAVDVDKAPWAMGTFGVRGVPTVKLFVDGEYAKDLKSRNVVKLLQEVGV